MKNVTLVAALLVLMSLPLFGQEPAAGSVMLGIGAEAGVPTGDFNNFSSFGIGGIATGVYAVDQNFWLSLKAGYLRFSGKDYTYMTIDPFTLSLVQVTTSAGSMNIIPIVVGGRYFFMPPADMRVYGGVDAGLYMLSDGNSTSKVGLAPALGAIFKAGEKLDVDVHANYSIVFTDVSNTSWVGVGVGLLFGLQ
jgi:hypothetical protein